MAPGSTRELARIASKPVHTIDDVVERLEQIRAHAAATALRGEQDGIAAFTLLYRIITQNVGRTIDAGGFLDPLFLTELDLQFARRYFAAIKAYAVDTRDAPRCWQTLFDHRSDHGVRPINFAAMGVCAHVKYDLTGALLTTWERFPPDSDGVQLKDYLKINDIFAVEMDVLRELFDSVLSIGEDGAAWDRFANEMSDLLVRVNRDLAWHEAVLVWRAPNRKIATALSDRKRDTFATVLNRGILTTPVLPV
jgi:Family of unknown function (DUF5995)